MKRPLWITAYDENFVTPYKQHFLASFGALELYKDFELQVNVIETEYGTYGEKQYRNSYAKELDRVIRVLETNRDRIVVWSDVDVRMYRNPLPDIMDMFGSSQIACQMDSPTVYCTGFQFFWNCQRIINFFREWQQLDNSKEWVSAQDSFNEQLKISGLAARALPERYWTTGVSGKQEVWDGVDVADLPDPPKDIVLHHGNFTIGLNNKMRMLNEIHRRVEGWC